MMVAVISDTHIPSSCSKIPDNLIKKLQGAELIIHAGDLTELSVLDELNKIARTEAVVGNMDSHQVRRALPVKKILTLGNFKIGIIHGGGHPDNLLSYIKERFKSEGIDCVVYGHSHRPSIDTIDSKIYFNPGSPTDKVFAPYNSFGILEIDEKIIPRIIRL